MSTMTTRNRFDWKTVETETMTLHQVHELQVETLNRLIGVDFGKKFPTPVFLASNVRNKRPGMVLDRRFQEFPTQRKFKFVFLRQVGGKTASALSDEQRAAARALRDQKRADKRARDRAIREKMKGGQGKKK